MEHLLQPLAVDFDASVVNYRKALETKLPAALKSGITMPRKELMPLTQTSAVSNLSGGISRLS